MNQSPQTKQMEILINGELYRSYYKLISLERYLLCIPLISGGFHMCVENAIEEANLREIICSIATKLNQTRVDVQTSYISELMITQHTRQDGSLLISLTMQSAKLLGITNVSPIVISKDTLTYISDDDAIEMCIFAQTLNKYTHYKDLGYTFKIYNYTLNKTHSFMLGNS